MKICVSFKKFTSLLLILVLLLTAIPISSTPAFAAAGIEDDEEPPFPIEVMLNACSNVTDITTMTGWYYQNTLYVSPYTLRTFANIIYQGKDETTGYETFLFYDFFNLRISPSGECDVECNGSYRRFHIPTIEVKEKVYYSIVDLLRRIGTYISFGADENARVHVSILCPYTIFQALEEMSAAHYYQFSWAELGNTDKDIEDLLYITGIYEYLFNFNGSFTDSWVQKFTRDEDGTYQLTKDMLQKALLQVVEAQGYDSDYTASMKNDMLTMVFDDADVGLSWMDSMLDALESYADKHMMSMTSKTVGVMKNFSSLASPSLVALQHWNDMNQTLSEYDSVTQNEKDLLDHTFLRCEKDSRALKLYPALREQSHSVSDTIASKLSGALGVDLGCEAIIDTVFDVGLDAIKDALGYENPVDLAFRTVSAAVHTLPIGQEILQASDELWMAEQALAIQESAMALLREDLHDFYENNYYIRYSNAQDRLDELKYDMLLVLKSGLAIRQHNLNNSFLKPEIEPLEKMNCDLNAELLYQVENCVVMKPVQDVIDTSDEIRWIKELEISPYYRYIKDERLPEMDYVTFETTYRTITTENFRYNNCWDYRRGLVSALIADLNQDKIKDCILLYYGPATETRFINVSPAQTSTLYADLLSMDEEGEVYLVETKRMLQTSNIGYQNSALGFVYIDKIPYFYHQNASDAYFADGSGYGTTFYTFNRYGLVPKWYVGKTDGGSSDIAYSLRTYDESGQNSTKEVLGGYYGFNNGPDSPLTFGEACEKGLERIQIDSYGYNNFWGRSSFPDLWNAEKTVDGLQYICSGTGNYSRRDMSCQLADATKLKEHIDLLIDEPPYY